MKVGDKVWKNEFGTKWCLECQPNNDFDFKQLKKHVLEDKVAANEHRLSVFEAEDRARVDSVLNATGNSFTYQHKPCHSHVVETPDFLLKRNNKQSKFVKTSYPTGWEKKLGHTNVQNYLGHKNILIRELTNKNDTIIIIYFQDLETEEI